MQMAQESAENLFKGSFLKGMPSKRDGFDWSFVSATLPKTNSSSMKIGWNPKRKGSSSNSQFSGALAVSFREGKSGKSWKTWGKQVASCETTSVSSSDMVISSSWSRELKITSIKLPLKTSAQRWWDRWDCWDTTCRSQGRWQFGHAWSGNFPVTSYPPIPMAPSLVSPPCVYRPLVTESYTKICFKFIEVLLSTNAVSSKRGVLWQNASMIHFFVFLHNTWFTSKKLSTWTSGTNGSWKASKSCSLMRTSSNRSFSGSSFSRSRFLGLTSSESKCQRYPRDIWWWSQDFLPRQIKSKRPSTILHHTRRLIDSHLCWAA